MKILIFSEACFNDNIIPLYRTMKEKDLDITCLINLSSLKIALFNIEKRIPKQGIIKATEYKELRIYEKYMNMDNLYLVNHDVDRKHPWREITRAIDVFNFIRKGNFDVIHTDIWYRRGFLPLYLFGYKTMFVQHDTFAHTGMSFSKWHLRYLKWAHKYNKAITILNKKDYNKFCEVYKLPSEKVYVNKLGLLDCMTIYSSESIQERTNNVLFFGRIVAYKGIEYLCDAMKIVHESIPDATVTIAGSGNYYFDKSEYEKLPYFEFHNRFIEEEELAKMLQECSISICTYTDATQSGGVLTSFAMNKPVIATNIDSMRELVVDDKFGILVPPRDSEALAKAIVQILQDDKKRLRIMDNIRTEYSEGVRSWSYIVDQYIAIYENILKKK